MQLQKLYIHILQNTYNVKPTLHHPAARQFCRSTYTITDNTSTSTSNSAMLIDQHYYGCVQSFFFFKNDSGKTFKEH
jgi:hypothetical protein